MRNDQCCGNCYFSDSPVRKLERGKRPVDLIVCINKECLWHELPRASFEGSMCPDYLPKYDTQLEE